MCESEISQNGFFLTFTCNMKKHYGMEMIIKWINSDEWNKIFNGFDNLSQFECDEIKKGFMQLASGILLRNWQEICILFINYLQRSSSSPFRNILSIFSRNEYQDDVGNLSHIHLILQIYWSVMTSDNKKFVKDLMRASTYDIVKPDEVQNMIDHGIFKTIDDYHDMVLDAEIFSTHICNERCLYRVGLNKFKCRKPNNLLISKDNTKHTYKLLPNKYEKKTVELLKIIGIFKIDQIHVNGYEPSFRSKHPYFHPKRHIPPTNHTGDLNISLVAGYFFSQSLSMQNVQVLTECGGVNKYFYKNIWKIDEQNFVIVYTDTHTNGVLVTKKTFLHNTKITTSKINEDKARMEKRENFHIQGRAIIQNEMIHDMLKYPDVTTQLKF